MISYYNDYKSFPYVRNPHEVPEPKGWFYYVSNHIKLKNNILNINSLPHPINLNNTKLVFDKKEIKSIINAQILNSAFNIDTTLSNDNIKLNAKSEKFLLSDILILLDKKGEFKKLFTQNKNSSFTN